MQNSFIARLLGKPAPTHDADAPAEATAVTVEEITIPTPAAKAGTVETDDKDTGMSTQRRIREDFTPDTPLTVERDPLHPENESGANVAKSETDDVHRRPRLGSISRPCPVWAARLTGCPWHTCAGVLVRHGHELYECQDCGTWFRRLPPDMDPLRNPGVNLGAEAVADEGLAFVGADEIEWVM